MSRPSFVSRLLLLLVIVLLLRSYPSPFGVVINGFIVFFSLFLGSLYIYPRIDLRCERVGRGDACPCSLCKVDHLK